MITRILIASALLCSTAGMASAQDVRTKVISYHSSDLYNAEKLADLRSEIEEAASDVCRQRGHRSAATVAAELSCRTAAIESADASINRQVAAGATGELTVAMLVE
jgi:UrcA family protein